MCGNGVVRRLRPDERARRAWGSVTCAVACRRAMRAESGHGRAAKRASPESVSGLRPSTAFRGGGRHEIFELYLRLLLPVRTHDDSTDLAVWSPSSVRGEFPAPVVFLFFSGRTCSLPEPVCAGPVCDRSVCDRPVCDRPECAGSVAGGGARRSRAAHRLRPRQSRQPCRPCPPCPVGPVGPVQPSSFFAASASRRSVAVAPAHSGAVTAGSAAPDAAASSRSAPVGRDASSGAGTEPMSEAW